MNFDPKTNPLKNQSNLSLSQYIKSLLPHGVSGRFYLIFLFPATLLVVLGSIFFVQKHFDRVTRQMVSNFTPQLEQILNSINSEDTLELAKDSADQIANSLGFNFEFDTNSQDDLHNHRVFYDLSSLIITNEIEKSFSSIRAIDFTISDLNELDFFFETNHGLAKIRVSRRVLSPSNPHQFLILIILTGMLTSLISIIYLRNQIKPIKRLAMAVENFSAGRDYHLVPSGADEVRSAINAFITMRDRIREQISQRSQLLVNISHDIRTPLTRLRLEAELIKDKKIQKALIEDIDQMNSMLEQLLEFATTGRTEPFSPTDLCKLIDEFVENNRHKEFQIIKEVSDEAQQNPTVYCLPMSIKRSLENLLSNSVRYATKAKISIHYTPEFYTITFEDNGIGIEKEKREEALKSFTRLDDSRNLNQSGSVGLGLAIVKKSMLEHNGSVKLLDGDELGGLKVELKIPSKELGRESKDSLVGLEGFEPPTKAL